MHHKRYFGIFSILLFTLFTTNSIAEIAAPACAVNSIFYSQNEQLNGFAKIEHERNLQVASYINSSKTVERQGCCSWHQGVCGCSGGRAVCCDGSYSPSCGC